MLLRTNVRSEPIRTRSSIAEERYLGGGPRSPLSNFPVRYSRVGDRKRTEPSIPAEPPFLVEIVGARRGSVALASGMPVEARRAVAEMEATDIIILPSVLLGPEGWRIGHLCLRLARPVLCHYIDGHLMRQCTLLPGDRLLEPERLTALLSKLARRRAEKTTAVERRLAELAREAGEAEEKLRRLYKLVEGGACRGRRDPQGTH